MHKFTLVCLTLTMLTGLVQADKKKTGELFLSPCVRNFDQYSKTEAAKADTAKQLPLVGKVVLVSLMKDGKLVRQTEMKVERWDLTVAPMRDLEHGTYTIKIEGPGIEKLIKSGVVVSATSSPTILANLEAGKGTRMIHYGEEGDPTIALKARITELEAEVARLKASK